ncbi:MAG: hypothetical protein ABIR48_04235 [Gammaproteobacteria bacterium]
MEKKTLIALAVTLFCGSAIAASDNPSSSSTSVGSSAHSASSTVTPFAQLDTNRDAALTKDELQSVPTIANNFDEIDFNGDGKIIEPDYYALMAAIEAGRAPSLPEYATLDVNKDGIVEQAEYTAFQSRLRDIDKLMLSGKLGSGSVAQGNRGTSVQGAAAGTSSTPADSSLSAPSTSGTQSPTATPSPAVP